MEDMERCPFCGGEGILMDRYRNGTANRKMYWVQCKACGVSQAHHDGAGYRTRAKAVAAWNRRYTPEEKKEIREYEKIVLTDAEREFVKHPSLGKYDAFTKTAVFLDGYEMDIKLCDGWTEAVLFRNGCETCCTEPQDDFYGEWELEKDGRKFVVEIV